MKKEIWKDIDGYEGSYQVSNLGRVKSYKSKKEKILKEYRTGANYSKVKLSKNNLTQQLQVHRLVALAFIPNIENKFSVNHLDENKKNNCVSNLEWNTTKENVRYYWRNKKSIAVIDVKTNNTIGVFKFIPDVAEFCNIKPGNINSVLSGRTKTANKKKYTFKYID